MRIKLKRITPVCILCNEEETGFEILNRPGSRHAPLEPRTDAREKGAYAKRI